MGKYVYNTSGTCSSRIFFEVNDEGVISDLRFEGGCNGNLQGISRLVVGRKAQDVVSTLQGIRCGGKPTSCPDQLARALSKVLEKTGTGVSEGQ